MLHTLRRVQKTYPAQFWLLFWGLLISTIGASMIWPFLMIYVSEKLNQPLTVAASLMTLNSTMGLIFAFMAGPVTDRVGRKWVMVISLGMNGLVYLFLGQASTLPVFAILLGLMGAFNPLFRVGSDAMMADLIPPEERADAYSLLRMSNNVGVALGPAIGGFLASSSYTIAFYSAATGMIIYSLMVMILGKETLTKELRSQNPEKERFGGYDRILKDNAFMSFIVAFTLTSVCAALIWVMMAVYAKQNFGVPESQYGFIPTTNALMVVLFQFAVTQWTKRYQPFPMMAFGALFYALGVGSVALAGGFWGFWIAMVTITIGELITSPVATTLAANLAPPSMRGRYMSIYGLTWAVAAGLGPIFGGVLNDQISPVAIWIGGMLVGLVSVAGFWLLSRRALKPVETRSGG